MRQKEATFRVVLALPVLALILVACAQVGSGGGLFEVQAEQPATQISDSKIRDLIISDSIRQYPGTCACPYNLARNGSRCGGRSAYSRAGGYSPLCYRSDVSDGMVQRVRSQQR